MGISWAYFGHILGMPWGYLGYVFDISWVYLLHIFGISCVKYQNPSYIYAPYTVMTTRAPGTEISYILYNYRT